MQNLFAVRKGSRAFARTDVWRLRGRQRVQRFFSKSANRIQGIDGQTRKQPAAFEATNPLNGKRESITMSREIFAEQIRTMLYIPIYWRWLPLLIHEANRNNFGPFATIAYANVRGIGRSDCARNAAFRGLRRRHTVHEPGRDQARNFRDVLRRLPGTNNHKSM